MSCTTYCAFCLDSGKYAYDSCVAMMCIFAYDLQGRNSDAEPTSMPVEVQTNSKTGTHIWKMAGLSLDTKADANLISHEFLSTHLSEEIKPLEQEEEETLAATALGREWRTCGCVDLVWSFPSSRKVHKTKFLVVEDKDTTFDMVIGRVGIQTHRLDGRNGHRSWREKWSLRKRRGLIATHSPTEMVDCREKEVELANSGSGR